MKNKYVSMLISLLIFSAFFIMIASDDFILGIGVFVTSIIGFIINYFVAKNFFKLYLKNNNLKIFLIKLLTLTLISNMLFGSLSTLGAINAITFQEITKKYKKTKNGDK